MMSPSGSAPTPEPGVATKVSSVTGTWQVPTELIEALLAVLLSPRTQKLVVVISLPKKSLVRLYLRGRSRFSKGADMAAV